MAPGPRPGTLEWLADQAPDLPVLLTLDGALTRGQWEHRADALADELACSGAATGQLLVASGRIGPDWFVASWAAAKLGAALAGLPPGPVLAPADALHVTSGAEAQHARPPRRFSGTSRLPDSLTYSRGGRLVRRSFTAAAVAAIAPVLADLVARLHAAPGTTLAVAGPVGDTLLGFLANVVLVGGGRVVSATEPLAALRLGAAHDATLAALSPADLHALAACSDADREDLDLTGLAVLVTGGAPLTPTARDVVDDLFGTETLIDVYATADCGVAAVRGRGEAHHMLLEGVAARVTAGGLLELRSPLAAEPGWNATGDRAVLTGRTGLVLG